MAGEVVSPKYGGAEPQPLRRHLGYSHRVRSGRVASEIRSHFLQSRQGSKQRQQVGVAHTRCPCFFNFKTNTSPRQAFIRRRNIASCKAAFLLRQAKRLIGPHGVLLYSSPGLKVRFQLCKAQKRRGLQRHASIGLHPVGNSERQPTCCVCWLSFFRDHEGGARCPVQNAAAWFVECKGVHHLTPPCPSFPRHRYLRRLRTACTTVC